jgi:hypothetical protein
MNWPFCGQLAVVSDRLAESPGCRSSGFYIDVPCQVRPYPTRFCWLTQHRIIQMTTAQDEQSTLWSLIKCCARKTRYKDTDNFLVTVGESG